MYGSLYDRMKGLESLVKPVKVKEQPIVTFLSYGNNHIHLAKHCTNLINLI